jgi:hypothetical protein
MLRESNWILIVTTARKDGTMFVFEPMSGVYAQVRELLDSDFALVELTIVVPRSQAAELQDRLTLVESDSHNHAETRALFD